MFWRMEKFMYEALAEADQAALGGDVPVGCVVVREGEIIARGHNRVEQDHDPTAHAEMLAIQAATAALGRERLMDCSLYVTLEPCAMCAGAIVLARIDHLVIGATDPKTGACGSLYDIVEDDRLNHRVQVSRGVLAELCGQRIRDFFAQLRVERVRPR